MSKTLLNKSFYSSRAGLVVRDVLVSIVCNADTYNDSLLQQLGLDRVGFNFIKNSGSDILFKLSERLLNAEAVKITMRNKVLRDLIALVESGANTETGKFDVKLITSPGIYQSLQITRNIISLIADSPTKFDGDLVVIDSAVHKLIYNLSAIQLDVLALFVASRDCVKISFDTHKVRSRLSGVMEYKRKEGIKDLLLSKRATTSMMTYLFPEENKLTIQTRRENLNALSCVGRPVSLTSSELDTLIRVWVENSELNELDKFLAIHREMAIDFDRIWHAYSLAKEEGHFEPSLIKAYQNRKNLACQID